ncbi:hypothetical protein KCU73_g135, partial [Aureobasidium melanogenum]
MFEYESIESSRQSQQDRNGYKVCGFAHLWNDLFRGLEELLATVDVEHEGHDVLWQVFGDSVELNRVVRKFLPCSPIPWTLIDALEEPRLCKCFIFAFQQNDAVQVFQEALMLDILLSSLFRVTEPSVGPRIISLSSSLRFSPAIYFAYKARKRERWLSCGKPGNESGGLDLDFAAGFVAFLVTGCCGTRLESRSWSECAKALRSSAALVVVLAEAILGSSRWTHHFAERYKQRSLHAATAWCN